MKTVNGKVTITRRSDDKIAIYIDDETSGLNICQVSMSLESFALALTNLGQQEAEVVARDNYKVIGLERETECIMINNVDIYDKVELKQLVTEHFINSGKADDGWMVHSDGTNSKQKPNQHEYIIRRFV